MILVTGATGLLGKQVVEDLLNSGSEVKALVRTESQKEKFKQHPHLTFAVGDVLDIISLEEALNGIEYCIHCAGLVSFSPLRKNDLYKINVEGTANVVNLCIDKKIKKLTHVSSVAAIGRPKGEKLVTELSVWEKSKTNTFYGYTKYLAELEVWRGSQEGGLSVAIVNPSIILGVNENLEQSSSKLFNYVLQKNKFYTPGGNNFVDVRDVSKAILKLTFSDIVNERFIVSATFVQYKELFEKIAQKLNVKAPSIKAGAFILGLTWRVEFLKSIFSGKEPALTKETARVSRGGHIFSSEKIIKRLNFSYTDINDTISFCCNLITKK